jgi:hypothetical protein
MSPTPALRRTALALLIGVGAIVTPAAAASPAACAEAADGPRAGLVIDTGARVLTYCVRLDGTQVSGIHLIELAAAQDGLDYAFGFGGAAVCRLAGVGVDGGDCFAAFPEFWGYWHGDGHGGWAWAPTGASAYRVADGGLEGWSWGSGASAATHAAPPTTAIGDVCVATPDPSPAPGGGAGDQGGAGSNDGGTGGAAEGGGAAGGAGAPAPSAGAAPGAGGEGGGDAGGGADAGKASSAPTTSPPSPSAASIEPTPSEDGTVRAAAEDAADRAPVPGVVGALAVIATLAVGGWWRIRRPRASR